MITLGFDPGGKNGFGCAAVAAPDNGGCCKVISVATVNSVDEAVAWSTHACGSIKPVSIGIDTLLFWQSTPSGWRGADEWLRDQYPAVRNSIACSNSLYGSMSVQGAILAQRMRSIWKDTLITETHPKVLWHHFAPQSEYPRNWAEHTSLAMSWLEKLGISCSICNNEHELDAIISAWASGQATSGAWSVDLTQKTASKQISDNISVCDQVHYFWPESQGGRFNG
jgi:hypothetical protein